jgi:peptidoglycan/LPS O-acetylase OafA/YrhL
VLIGGILLDKRQNAGFFSTFYLRSLRLLPLYWILLTVATMPKIAALVISYVNHNLGWAMAKRRAEGSVAPRSSNRLV